MVRGLVSIIIPTYNRLSSLLNTLESVFTQQYGSYEIIVVDDGSTDTTVETLKETGRVKLYHTGGRKGPSRARNIGLGAANGEFVWFLDSDVILPDGGILERMVSAFRTIPDIGSIGGEIVVPEGMLDLAYGRRVFWNAYNTRVVSNKENEYLQKCDYLATCNCFTKREYAIKLNGFDEQFVFGAEDMDFGVRIKKLNLINYVNYKYGVCHYHNKSGRFEDESLRYQETRIKYVIKHYSNTRKFVIFCYDIVLAGFFYTKLLPKLVIKLFKNQKISKQNIYGGWYMIKPYFNLIFYK